MDVKEIISKHKSAVSYIFFSGITAVIETLIGLTLINFAYMSEVPANILGILVGSCIHYVCVTKKSFNSHLSLATGFIYIGTFLLGLILQNLVVWAACKLMNCVINKNIAYVLAKGLSLVVSFLALYNLRKILYNIADRGNQK